MSFPYARFRCRRYRRWNLARRISVSAALQRLRGRVISRRQRSVGLRHHGQPSKRLGVIVDIDLERGARAVNRLRSREEHYGR